LPTASLRRLHRLGLLIALALALAAPALAAAAGEAPAPLVLGDPAGAYRPGAVAGI